MASTPTNKVLKLCCEALAEKKASDLKILKVAEKSSITDYFVIVTGTSEPHLNALRKELERRLSEINCNHLRINYTPESGWAIIDGFDFMVHIFLENKRKLYNIEGLWKDGEVIDPGML